MALYLSMVTEIVSIHPHVHLDYHYAYEQICLIAFTREGQGQGTTKGMQSQWIDLTDCKWMLCRLHLPAYQCEPSLPMIQKAL